jgi:hypothetical protein
MLRFLQVIIALFFASCRWLPVGGAPHPLTCTPGSKGDPYAWHVIFSNCPSLVGYATGGGAACPARPAGAGRANGECGARHARPRRHDAPGSAYAYATRNDIGRRRCDLSAACEQDDGRRQRPAPGGATGGGGGAANAVRCVCPLPLNPGLTTLWERTGAPPANATFTTPGAPTGSSPANADFSAAPYGSGAPPPTIILAPGRWTAGARPAR